MRRVPADFPMPEAFSVRTEQHGDAAVVVPTVEFAYKRYDRARRVATLGLSPVQLIDDDEIRAVRRTLLDMAKQEKYRRMILDLSSLDSLPSMLVACLLALARRCEKAGGKLRLCGLAEGSKRMIHGLRLERVIGCYADRLEALNDPWE